MNLQGIEIEGRQVSAGDILFDHNGTPWIVDARGYCFPDIPFARAKGRNFEGLSWVNPKKTSEAMCTMKGAT